MEAEEPVVKLTIVVEETTAMVFDTAIQTDLGDVVKASGVKTLSSVKSTDRTGMSVDHQHRVAYEAIELDRHLQNMRQELQALATSQCYTAATAVTATSSLSVGYVLWAIRGGWLASSILAQMPAWRLIDPLVVLSSLDGTDGIEDDDSIQAMLKKGVEPRNHNLPTNV